jgi:hypothetical protein
VEALGFYFFAYYFCVYFLRRILCVLISRPYFSAAAGLALVFAAGLAAALVVCSDARRARVLTRLAALDRLRVFLRALVFGMGFLIFMFEDLGICFYPTLRIAITDN